MLTREAVAGSPFEGPGKVRVPKAAEIIADDIRRRIVRGELGDGAALPTERTLMEEFGVSRPTLREAFRILESESLLTVRRGARGGARIHPPSAVAAARYAAVLLTYRGAGSVDVRAARAAIETAGVVTLAIQRGGEDVKELRRALRAVEDAAAGGEQFTRAADDFRRALVTAVGNIVLLAVWEMLGHVPTEPPTWEPAAAGTAGVAARRTLRACRTVVELIRRGDADAARRCWAEHPADPGPATPEDEPPEPSLNGRN